MSRPEPAAASARRCGEPSRDLDLQQRMEAEILRRFPGCPRERASEIARHTALRLSGRVGRSAAGRALFAVEDFRYR